MKKLLFVIICSGLLAGCWTVKSGQKSGVIIKVAKEGMWWGTYEGEIILGGLENASGASARTFDFTFGQYQTDLVKKARSAMENNKHVVINYHCEAFTMPWSGETKCFVSAINILPEEN